MSGVRPFDLPLRRRVRSAARRMARCTVLLGCMLLESFAAAANTPSAADDLVAATQYVQGLLNGMVAVSERPTRERRAFYENFLRNEIDWNAAGIRALGTKWSALGTDERRKLAEWARDSVMGEESVMEFIQNLIFRGCFITSRSAQNEGSAVRFSCVQFGNIPNFSLRLHVARRSERFQIIDVGYVGISLMEELGDAMLDHDSVARHGVNVEPSRAKQ